MFCKAPIIRIIVYFEQPKPNTHFGIGHFRHPSIGHRSTGLEYFGVGNRRAVLRLGAAGVFCGWELQAGRLGGCARHILGLGNAKFESGGRLGGDWGNAPQLCTAGMFCGWALQGCSAIGGCWDTVQTLCGWALPGYSAVGFSLHGG